MHFPYDKLICCLKFTSVIILILDAIVGRFAAAPNFLNVIFHGDEDDDKRQRARSFSREFACLGLTCRNSFSQCDGLPFAVAITFYVSRWRNTSRNFLHREMPPHLEMMRPSSTIFWSCDGCDGCPSHSRMSCQRYCSAVFFMTKKLHYVYYSITHRPEMAENVY